MSAAGGQCSVRVAGPDSRHAVLLLPDTGDPVDVYDAVSERLHNSDLKTVALESIDGVSDNAILTVLDELKLSWVHLVGSGAGAESAWTLAAKTFGRFASLIAVNRCHPAIADEQGTVRAADCPPGRVADDTGRRLLTGPRIRRRERSVRLLGLPRGPTRRRR